MYTSSFALLLLLAEPAGGRNTHAGIEVGGKGVKATVVEVAAGGSFRRLYGRTHNTTLSVLENGAFRPPAIDDAASAIAGFYKTFRDTYKLPPERIHIVGSSGVPQATNRAAFVTAVKKATGKDMRFIDDRTEVALTIAGVVPKAERDTALSLDVGSGNTKGGYFPAGKPLVYASVPLGTVTFTERVRQEAMRQKTTFLAAAEQMRDRELVKPLTDGARAMADLPVRKKVYLSGGMVWAMITLVRPENIDDAYVTFTTADIDAFTKLVAGSRFPGVSLTKVADEGRKLRAKAEAEAVGKAYSVENLQAGAQILQALVRTFALEKKTLVFPRNAAFGWLAAYVAGEEGK